MSAQDRVRWDSIFRERLDAPFPDPNPLLLEFVPPLPEGRRSRALDLACGLGQNGLWLASQGYSTDLMDISRVALNRARKEMQQRNLRNINLLQVDLDDQDLEDEVYEVTCVFYYLKRSILRKLLASVAPGGRLVYETFNMLYLERVPEFNTEFLLSTGELETIFAGWNVLHHDETDHISQIVAVKPLRT